VRRKLPGISLLSTNRTNELPSKPPVLFLFIRLASRNDSGTVSPGRDNAIVESLLRIPDAKMEAYPQHTDAIKRYLKKTAGTAQYLRVVGQLGVTGEDSNLSAMLNAVPVSTESTQAAKWLLENGRKSLVQAAIAHKDDEKASAALSATRCGWPVEV
jgi:hypothetical protein